MPTFEALPCFERDWKNLSGQQQSTFRKVITEVFAPDLAAPDRPFRPGLRVKGVTAHLGVFEMTWDNDGRATFSYGEERIAGQAHVIWRRIGTLADTAGNNTSGPGSLQRGTTAKLELGGPGAARGPARRDTQSAAPGDA